MGLHRTLGERKTEPFYLCRLPVSGVYPLWSFGQGETTKMLASFENEEDAIKADDFRISRCGERNGTSAGLGHSLCPGWSLKAFWKTFYYAPWKHHPSLIAAVLWGGKNTPVLADIILFSASVQIQRALDVSWLSCLLTNSKSLWGSLCFPALGFQGSVRGVVTGGVITSESTDEGSQSSPGQGRRNLELPWWRQRWQSTLLLLTSPSYSSI